MSQQEFHSNGKLLITGEYLVLHGGLALAMPTKPGQKLEINQFNNDHPVIHWRTWIKDRLWFDGEFSIPFFNVLKTSNTEVANRLSAYFIEMAAINPTFIDASNFYKINSTLDFEIEWGLGSSSSLISNLAYWAKIDPYELHFRISRGSGYDIACSRSDGPLLYKLSDGEPHVEEVDFDPPFKNNLYFVYSGNKQDSSVSVSNYLSNKKPGTGGYLKKCAAITNKIVDCRELDTFEELISEHEEMIGQLINMPPVKEEYYPDFKGHIKSLGAWGGDFLLVTWKGDRKALEEYFSGKGLDVLFAYDEIIKNEA